MTKAEMADHLARLQQAERVVREDGQREYAHDVSNAFANFERVGQQLGLPREKVLLVYLMKHLDGIVAHCNGHVSQREPVQGRIKDARMYLALLDGMVTEDEKFTKTEESA